MSQSKVCRKYIQVSFVSLLYVLLNATWKFFSKYMKCTGHNDHLRGYILVVYPVLYKAETSDCSRTKSFISYSLTDYILNHSTGRTKFSCSICKILHFIRVNFLTQFKELYIKRIYHYFIVDIIYLTLRVKYIFNSFIFSGVLIHAYK
jgi:hypothetical protein